MTITPSRNATYKLPPVGKVPLSDERSGDGQNRDDDEETPHEDRERKGKIIKRRIRIKPGKRAAIGRRGERVGIQDFRIAVRTRITEGGKTRLAAASETADRSMSRAR
jgi:hypothetical protein